MARTHYHVVIDYMPEPTQISSIVAARKACSEQVRQLTKLYLKAMEGTWNGYNKDVAVPDTIVEIGPCNEIHD